jgi:hypothetical protein
MVAKGFTYTLEIVIGTVFVLLMLSIYFVHKPITEMDTSIGYKCLRSLDKNNILEYYSVNKDEQGLSDSLKGCLPPSYEFRVRICENLECSVTLPENKTIIVTSYLVSGFTTFNPAFINLWMWKR